MQKTTKVVCCPKCSKEVTGRRKYCSDHCKYLYNAVRKEREANLPPVKKRNNRFFSMIVGYKRAKMKGGQRQGRRSGSMVVGSMAAMINCTIEEWVELTPENLKRHFSVSFCTTTGIRLGNGEFVKKEDISTVTGIDF